MEQIDWLENVWRQIESQRRQELRRKDELLQSHQKEKGCSEEFTHSLPPSLKLTTGHTIPWKKFTEEWQ